MPRRARIDAVGALDPIIVCAMSTSISSVKGSTATERTVPEYALATPYGRASKEERGAKSVFHFDVPGSVAKSTHAGLPWLKYLRQKMGERVHIDEV
jgi:hypothetical protein